MRCLLVCALVACTGADGYILEPDLGVSGRADGVDLVHFRGSVVLGTPITGMFTTDMQFDGYMLDVRAGAQVKLDITHSGSSSRLDTTLWVYGPANLGGSFPSEALAMDNDGSYGKLSRLTTTLDAGRYAVVVGTKNGKGRGKYRLVPSCLSGDCAPLAEIPLGGCPAPFTNAVRTCVTENVGEYEPLTSYMNFAEQCADPDVLAPIYDQTCTTAQPWCGDDFQTFHATYAEACTRDVKNTILDGFCVFGTTYGAIADQPNMHLVESVRLTASTTLTTLDRAQIVSAMKASSHDDVMTAAQAFDRADSGEIFRRRWWDSSARKAYTSFEYGAGDNSFGRIFAHGSSTMVAQINDGDIYPQSCTAKWGAEIRDCTDDIDCKPGAMCVGRNDDTHRGSCIATQTETPNEGASCTTDVACGADSGLLCAGASRSPEGMCLPAWQRRSFVSEPLLAIPDNKPAGATAHLYTFGLATVDMDVWLKLNITHPRAGDLVVTLENPATTTITIAIPAGANVDLDIPVAGFSGDESVTGLWKLKVVDKASGRTGTIDRVELRVGSRWD